MSVTSHRAQALSGTVRAPGDKSISHRSMILGADILSTAVAMQDFGAEIERQKDGSWTVIGCGVAGFKSPTGEVDCGNAGTGVRLIMGAASGYQLTATFTGDASLSSRPP